MEKQQKESRVVLITGALGGIGRAMVEKFLEKEKETRVCATDRPSLMGEGGKGQKSREEILRQFGPERVLFLPMDVKNSSSIEEAKSRLLSRWGRLDLLINNAGVFESRPLEELTEKSFKRLLDINLLGVFRSCLAFLPVMKEQKKGKIINISSLAATKGAPRASHYAASKGGLLSFSRSLAVELAPYGIQVNTILPGYIDTPMLSEHLDSIKKLLWWKSPVKRPGHPGEVAEVVYCLSQVETNYLTGSELVLDGGYGLG